MGQGGAVARSISSEKQVRLGQYGISMAVTHICECPGASCVPVHPCREYPRPGNKTVGNGSNPERQTGLPVRLRRDPKPAGPPEDGVATLPEAQAVVIARRLHD